MRRFNNFMNNENMHEFKTYLPIQLDGTCNGFQHLALLSSETEIFDKLNLGESKKSNDPADFYSHIVDILSVHLESKKKNHLLEIERLELLESENIQTPPLDTKLEKDSDSLMIREKIMDLKDEIKSIERLLNLGITRNTIKPVIMNKPYNATDKTLTAYIRSLLVFAHTEETLELDIDGNQILDEKGKPKILHTS